MKNLVECISHITDENLRKALTEAYAALIEAKVNGGVRELYNFLVSTGDWVPDNGGKHDNKLRIATPPEFQEYLRNNFKQNEAGARSFANAIPFSTTKNSDGRNLENLIHQAAAAYRMACVCEYELKHHDVSSMEWPGKAKEFERAFCAGKPVWTPPEAPVEKDNPLATTDQENYMVTNNGQSYEERWRAYADKNRKMRKH